ncbi:MAG: hypothetical protein HOG03_17505 [Desulfobacula sp.]|jgi:hypothetical protein|uniref:hypothetical protein n=1 Tax=Desulfobacula sp. TaxID=2593537 RepID=UPI001E115394|nr:hypothetical protein [Desulfobacula sp.]MBT3486755.1 hypothetical protein [Desulfobacula sp.]MBT3806375.1 hypothetical protein [Desulfobacula sp.]MBT4023987.1 hypothetical protein [Desulfobacula sp.]MBT4198349.1 hypothetical protein [Desulfobacula sp.]
MHKKKLPYLILILSFFISSVSFCYAQGWELIGEKKASSKKRTIDIEISDKGSYYQKIRFGVKITSIRIVKIIAYAGDGQKYEIDYPIYIKQGEFTPKISISENPVNLIKVRLIYKARKRVIVKLYGIKARKDD